MLYPGESFPNIVLSAAGGGTISTQAQGKPTLLVVYRGVFCPFCTATMANLVASYQKIKDNGFEIIAISADKEAEANKIVADYKIPFPVGYGLTEAQIKQIGAFASDPTSYIPQKHTFSEPAWFFLNDNSKIKYLEYASAPMGGRPNVDNLIAGYNWSTQNAKDHPEFRTVVWGSKRL